MPKKIEKQNFVELLKRLDSAPTLVEYGGYKKLSSATCSNCDTEFTTHSYKMLRAPLYGCPECIQKMKIEQTKKMSILVVQDYVVEKRRITYEKTGCGKVGAIKTAQTKAQRYGDPTYCNPDKIKSSKVEHHGDARFNNREKAKLTLRQKFGVDYVAQVPEYHRAQTVYKRKSYTLPSGKTVLVQGYEDKALDLIFESGIDEQDLEIENIPSVKYFWSSFDGFGDDKWHRYHPDIYIKSMNKIIEVKSAYTFDGNDKIKSKNLSKETASKNAGFNFEFWIL